MPIPSNFGVFLLDQIAHVRVRPSVSLKLIAVKLFSKYFNLSDHYVVSTNVTDGQTDGRHAIARPRFAIAHRAVITTKRMRLCSSLRQFLIYSTFVLV